MSKKAPHILYTGLVFGEGGADKKFLQSLISLEKFRYHTSKWFFNYDNGSGGSPESILQKCRKASESYDYNLVLCFIDLDDLKHDYPKSWLQKQKELETTYSDITIIWQYDNAEDEYKRVIGAIKGKYRLKREAKKQIELFINSEYWHRILSTIQKREKEIEEKLPK